MVPMATIAMFNFAFVVSDLEPPRYSLNLYGGVMTSNDWQEVVLPVGADFEKSYLGAITLARHLGTWHDKVEFEVEGQVVKHFEAQDHWEFNALATGRWLPFWWDHVVDTSLAFGLGPSYATQKPEIEIQNDGITSRWLIYWMLELSLAHPRYTNTAFIARVHHRSDAFGLVPNGGGSNALVMGVKQRF